MNPPVDAPTLSGLSPVPSPPNAADGRGTEATRYLCAGAYLDVRYRDHILEEVLYQRLRSVAPSYGIDIVPVLRHALQARRHEAVRDLVLFVTLLLTLVLAPEVALLALVLSAIVFAVRSLTRALRTLSTGRRQREFEPGVNPGVNPGADQAVNPGFNALIPGILVLLVIYYVAAHGVSLPHLGGGGGDTSDSFSGSDSSSGSGISKLVRIGSASFAFGFLMLLVGWAAVTAERWINHRILVDQLSPGRFDPAAAPPEPAAHRERIGYLAEAQTGNVTYFARRRASTPFVGHGQLLRAWQLTTPLVREGVEPDEAGFDPDEASAPLMSVDDFYTQMRRSLAHMIHRKLPDSHRLQGVNLQERLFVPGLLPERSGMLDPERHLPRYRIGQAEMRALGTQGRGRAAHFLSTRIASWDGELEVTVFMYFSVQGNMLYIELEGTALPSIKEAFHRVDSFEKFTTLVRVRHAWHALGDLPGLAVRSPARLWRMARNAWFTSTDLRAQRHDITRRLAFEYGARASVRELGAEPDLDQFFQLADGLRYFEVVQRRAIRAIAEVMAEFGYSTEEFINRAMSVVNHHTVYADTVNGPMTVGGSQTNYGRPAPGPARPTVPETRPTSVPDPSPAPAVVVPDPGSAPAEGPDDEPGAEPDAVRVPTHHQGRP